eukprot:GEZU01019014.1.p1 GENE.GEZU01019014.1~~GEZU01019014.1.p1  ORF type:complete len:280 (-),score=62.26 GEZU01019014.1:117-956(-)
MNGWMDDLKSTPLFSIFIHAHHYHYYKQHVHTHTHTQDIFKSNGDYNKVPTMIGASRHEFSLAFFSDPRYCDGNHCEISQQLYNDTVLEYLGPALAPVALAQYDITQYESYWSALNAMLTDYFYVCPIREVASFIATTNSHQNFMFWFEHKPSFEPQSVLGAYRSSQLPFIFGTPCFLSCNSTQVLSQPSQSGFDETEDELMMVVRAYLRAMASPDANPNLYSTYMDVPLNLSIIEWPVYQQSTAGNWTHLLLDLPLRTTSNHNNNHHHCDFWNDYYYT